MSHTKETYMHRCLQLARLGEGKVAPNPMVGSVLVYEDRIIGEGYHQKYGEAHAEVTCIRSVAPADRHLIPQSTLYVSLEPCAHFGKTPPCADLVIRERIPKVVIGCRDPFLEVNGKGIEKLQAAGIQTEVGVLEEACLGLNKRFFTFHTERRPYVVLKWAETADGKIAGEDYSRVRITGPATNRLVHRWRSEEMAIMVGTNTALFDDPELTTRLWPGNNPVRLVLDLNGRLPSTLKLFDGSVPVLVFNKYRNTVERGQRVTGVAYYAVGEDASLVHQILNALYHLNIQSVLVEGGAQLLQSFLEEEAWDEARVLTNEHLYIGPGLPAPHLSSGRFLGSQTIGEDTLRRFAAR